MPRDTYLYENRMFTNKVRHSIVLGKKALGAKRKVLAPIKSLIYARVKRCALGAL